MKLHQIATAGLLAMGSLHCGLLRADVPPGEPLPRLETHALAEPGRLPSAGSEDPLSLLPAAGPREAVPPAGLWRSRRTPHASLAPRAAAVSIPQTSVAAAKLEPVPPEALEQPSVSTQADDAGSQEEGAPAVLDRKADALRDAFKINAPRPLAEMNAPGWRARTSEAAASGASSEASHAFTADDFLADEPSAGDDELRKSSRLQPRVRRTGNLERIFVPAEAGEAQTASAEEPQGEEVLRPLVTADDLKPIGAISTAIIPAAGELPASPASEWSAGHLEFCYRSEIRPVEVDHPVHHFAAAFCHRPLYFEQPNLERSGYHHGFFQPAWSAAHFFTTVPILPYKMAIDHPQSCIWTGCRAEPGYPGPWVNPLPPLRVNAGMLEAGLITGLVFLIP